MKKIKRKLLTEKIEKHLFLFCALQKGLLNDVVGTPLNVANEEIGEIVKYKIETGEALVKITSERFEKIQKNLIQRCLVTNRTWQD